MTSIDELFKKPAVPGGSSKRKLNPAQNPTEIYKSTKLSANGDVKGKLHGLTQATVEDDDEEEEQEAGPELPPDEGGLDDTQDDEEGRFFGEGVSRDTADVLDFIESREGENQETTALEKFDSAWLKRLAVNFERKISKNAELRAKFESEPQKFMGSEADLDADIKSLSILTEHPELYVEFADLGCLASLASLVAHENTDIAIDAIEILAEITDEDVQAEQDQWDAVVDALLEADLPSLLVDNLARLDESNEADRNGVYHTLSLLENLCSDPARAETITESSKILEWLLSRIQKADSPVSQNMQYATEILCIVLQSSTTQQSKIVAMNGIDTILQLLSVYRRQDPPKNSEEEEYAENLFDALICLVEDNSSSVQPLSGHQNSAEVVTTQGKSKFAEAEGLELLLIMLRDANSKFGKPRALRVLDTVLSGDSTSGADQLCEKFVVELAGLKTVFSLFMKQKHQGDAWTSSCLGIFASLLRCLPGESPARIRTLAKFVEKNYEKVERLVALRDVYRKRLEPVQKEVSDYQTNMSEEEKRNDLASLTSQLDAGLTELQNIDVVLAWLIAEDDGAKDKISTLLTQQAQSLDDVKTTLSNQLYLMDQSNSDTAANGEKQGNDTADMLSTLIEFLV